MKALVIFWLILCSNGYSKADQPTDTNQNENSQPLNQYLAKKQVNSFRPISGTQENGDRFQFNIVDHTNEIPKGTHYSNYQTIPSNPSPPPPSTLSTRLKQVSPSSSNSANDSPMFNVNSPTPVIMQYMPGTIPGTRIQYLQLIPTRPLIVPISPFIASSDDSFSPVSSTSFPSPTQPTSTSSLSPTYASTSSLSPFQPSPSPSYRSFQPSFRPMPRGVPLMPPAPSTAPSRPAYQHPQILANSSPRSLAGTNLLQSSSTSSSLSYLSPNYQFIPPNEGLNFVDTPNELNLNTNEYMPSYGTNGTYWG